MRQPTLRTELVLNDLCYFVSKESTNSSDLTTDTNLDSLPCDTSVLLDDHQYVIQNHNENQDYGDDHQYAHLATPDSSTLSRDQIKPHLVNAEHSNSVIGSKKAFVKKKRLLSATINDDTTSVTSSNAVRFVKKPSSQPPQHFPSKRVGDSLLKVQQNQIDFIGAQDSVSCSEQEYTSYGSSNRHKRAGLKLVLPLSVTTTTSTSVPCSTGTGRVSSGKVVVKSSLTREVLSLLINTENVISDAFRRHPPDHTDLTVISDTFQRHHPDHTDYILSL